MRRSFTCVALVATLALFGAGCSDDDDNNDNNNNPTTETNCNDNADNDMDGDFDCDDSDCAADPACAADCGDGTCDTANGETRTTCATDCDALCGNSTCDTAAGETVTNCAQDCDACGDGVCAAGETATSCAADCNGSSCAQALPMALATEGYFEADGVLDPAGDSDYYSFTVEADQWFQIMTDANPDDITDNIDTVITLYNADGSTVLAEKDDAAPRISTDTELYHRFVTAGTYCLRVWEFSEWYGDTPVGGPTFTYNLTALPIDFTAHVGVTEDEEPNDALATASPADFQLADTIHWTNILGEFDGALATDVDWYSFTSAAGQSGLSVEFTPGEGIDDAYGSSVDPATVELLAANGTTIIASLNVGMGSDGLAAVVLESSTDYLIRVTAPSGSMGANPFYVLKAYHSDSLNPQESWDATNNVWTNAEAMDAQPPEDGTVSHFIGGTLDVSGGSDTDWWSFTAATGNEISIACSSWRAGSGVRDAKFSLYGTDATAAVLYEQTETESTDVYWGSGTDASHAAITTTATGTHYFKVSAATQDANVTSSHYLCGVHVNTP